ncbi:MAG: alpha/beta hydrolase [Leptospiraceae bacterium]|nr:alpha/beta hydrolase [Leptospiraceae bacterium]MDW7976216.1 alpha/beta hydrolase [Leptospiraceae bacterium]
MNSIKFLILFLLFFYLSYNCFLYFIQDKILFYPVPYNEREIRTIEKTYPFTFKTFYINEKKITYWESNNHNTRHVVFYFGGNAENTNYTLMEISSFNRALEFRWILLNYPGYNGSSGTPSESSFFEYAELLYHHIVQNHNYEKISFMGRSIGSGVASYLASKVKASKLILITPFDSVENLAKKYYPFTLSQLVKHKFLSYKYIQNVSIPILILAAENDEVVPLSSTKNLIQYISDQRKMEFYILDDTTHNTISDHPEYWKFIYYFLIS